MLALELHIEHARKNISYTSHCADVSSKQIPSAFHGCHWSDTKLAGRVPLMGDDMLLDTSDESVSVTWCETMSLCCIGAFPLSARDDADPKLSDCRRACAAFPRTLVGPTWSSTGPQSSPHDKEPVSRTLHLGSLPEISVMFTVFLEQSSGFQSLHPPC